MVYRTEADCEDELGALGAHDAQLVLLISHLETARAAVPARASLIASTVEAAINQAVAERALTERTRGRVTMEHARVYRRILRGG
jgi:hypothetical protein